MSFVPWRAATEEALYGERGFFRRGAGPAAHFRTSVHASPLFASALASLAAGAGLRRVVDIGAGRGELLAGLHGVDPTLELVGIDVVARPADLPPAATWHDTGWPRAGMLDGILHESLVVANEWLDDVPCDVAVVSEGRWRLVLVDPATGAERIGEAPADRDLAWLQRWWPAGTDGDRAEIGRPRDEAWAGVVARMARGVAVAVDYHHTRADRAAGRVRAGTLAGYRDGRAVPPVPDGSCDVTAHVALDACADAGDVAGATSTVLTTQRTALRRLGVSGDRPPLELATTDPVAYVRGLALAGEAAELTSPDGLGGLGWLLQDVSRR